MNVTNGKTIRGLTARFLKAHAARNVIVVVAVALTATMFTSVFTIGGNMLAAVQDQTMRQVGTSAHGGLKYLTQEQYENFVKSPLIEDIAYDRFLAIAENDALKKEQFEIRYAEDKKARWGFSFPSVGGMPQAENEVACSTIVLDALGVPHEIGANVPLEFTVGDKKYSEVFTLSGYWKGDPVMMAQQVWLSKRYVDKLLAAAVITDQYTGAISADVRFGNAFDIGNKMQRLIFERGYSEPQINYGVNWAYMAGADVDPTVIAIGILLIALILLSGYLIINSIFVISVNADIHFYGLLKTIGTTGRQIRRIVFGQALVLSVAGIPLGLLIGYIAGARFIPAILELTILGEGFSVSAHPLIFVFAAAFGLFAVFAGCRKPGRIASRVSPVEAVRYNGAGSVGKRRTKRTRKVTPLSMAWANVTREKRKLVVIVLSLSLSLILLNSAFSATRSFDMDAYVSDSIVGDFAVADRTVFNYVSTHRDFEGVPSEFSEDLVAHGATDIAAIYYHDDSEHALDGAAYDNFLEAVSALRPMIEREYPKSLQSLDECVEKKFLATQIYGVGRLAAESFYDDYDKLASGDYALSTTMLSGSTDYPVYGAGDKVTLTNAEGESRSFEVLEVIEDYPYSISARESYIPGQTIIIADDAFTDFYGKRGAMQVNFNVSDKNLSDMESWLAEYTTDINPETDYASRETLKTEFDGLQSTYLTLGGAMSFILALIGILNFINAVAASVIARRRELAVMQSVGMTGKQLRQTLFSEGVCFAALAALFTLTAGLGFGQLITRVIAGNLWFFKQSFTVTPSLYCMIPLFLICAVSPLICYARLTRDSLVERLGKAE